MIEVDVGPAPKDDLSAALQAARTALKDTMKVRDSRTLDDRDWQLIRVTVNDLASCVSRLERWEGERVEAQRQGG